MQQRVLSQKSYQTARGEKTVTAYLIPVNNEEVMLLKAGYESEGNNICRTICDRLRECEFKRN